MTSACYVGIDVAKAELVVSTTTTPLGRFANDRGGFRDLVKRLQQLEGVTVVLESTGRYGQDVTAALMAAGYPVAVVPPSRVRNFARSLGRLAKTDPIDAQVIAQFGEATKPRLLCPVPAEVACLRALVGRRDQVIEMRTREQNHLEACSETAIAKELRLSIARLKKIEADYTAKIERCLAEDQDLARVADALQGESGVGLQTAATLLAHMPELGRLNRQRVAALAGLAPFNRDSGTQCGKRAVFGGRSRLRRALYMAAISASRWNPWISEMYKRLRQRGKVAKVALVACARKLLTRLNSIAARVIAQTPQRALAPC